MSPQPSPLGAHRCPCGRRLVGDPVTGEPLVVCRAEGCGRRLSDAVSVSVRMGPVCRERAGIVVVTLRQDGQQVHIARDGHRRVDAGPGQLALDLEAAS